MPARLCGFSILRFIHVFICLAYQMIVSRLIQLQHCLILFIAVNTLWSGYAEAIERRISVGDLFWTSAGLQGSAGIGGLSESWVDHAQTDVSALARRKQSVELELLSPTVSVSQDAVNSVMDTINAFTSDSGTSSSSSSAQTTVNALEKVRSVFGKSMSAQQNLSVLGIRIKRVGLVPYQTALFDASIDNASWPKLDAYLGGYAGVLISYAQPIGKDFDFGLALRPGVGGYRNYEIDLSLLGDYMNDSSSPSTSNQSQVNSFDFPTAAYVPLDVAAGWWLDSSTRVYLSSKNTFDAAPVSVMSGEAGRMQNSISSGLTKQISLSGSKNQSLFVGAAMQDLAGMKRGWNEFLLRTQFAGKYALKLPFRDQTTFALNFGLRSGYPVASVFLDLFLAKFEFALSTREMGGYPGQRPSRLMTLTARTQMQF